jgi:hypothetical protein
MVTVDQVLPFVRSFAVAAGERMTDGEVRAFIQALGPTLKAKIKRALTEETTIEARVVGR